MRKITRITWICLILAGCAQEGGLGPIDAQQVLSTMDGPKVPTVGDTLTKTAKDAEQAGNFKQAAQLYRQVLEKQPDNMDVALALADCYRRGDDLDNAITIYDGVLMKDPTNPVAKEGKGLALMAKGDFDTPAGLFDDVIKVDPTRWKTLNGLGILFTTRGLQPQAQKYFQEALHYNPGNVSVMNNLGLSEAMDKEYEDALAMLEKASFMADPQQKKRVDLNRALVYAIAGQMDQATAITQQYYSGAALNNNLGLYAHLAKDDQLAKTYLNMALTDSKVFYEKAWDNLKDLGGDPVASTDVGDAYEQLPPSAGGDAQ